MNSFHAVSLHTANAAHSLVKGQKTRPNKKKNRKDDHHIVDETWSESDSTADSLLLQLNKCWILYG